MRTWVKVGVFLCIVCLPGGSALACTTAFLPNSSDRLFVKSYDWGVGSGALVINKRNVEKKSVAFLPDDKATTWTSKFGSLTFNQHGREFPLGGINEKGLAVEIMWLQESVYPKPDDRASLNELQWIQYHLDNYDSVEKMAADADDLRISKIAAPVHYLACDAGGDCASFEYLQGKLVIHQADSLVVPTLTNDTYANSVDYLSGFQGYGGSKTEMPGGDGSLQRFVRATMVAAKNKPGCCHGFEVLKSVESGATKWRIVYSLSSGDVRFRSNVSPTIKRVDATAFDYSCKTPVKLLEVNHADGGDVTRKFIPYTEALNLKMIKEGLAGSGLSLPPGTGESLAKYPASTRCTE